MRLITVLLILVLSPIYSYSQSENITILHTNDWQSRLLGYGPQNEYKPNNKGDGTKGGVARLASLIKKRKKLAKEFGSVLLFDSGDFTMGTLFHTISREFGTELQLMKLMGYDAVGLGNHEFDFGPEGLSSMILSAKSRMGSLSPLLCSNIIFSKANPLDKELKDFMADGTLSRYKIIQKGTKKIGVFSLMGIDASDVSLNRYPIEFGDPIQEAKKYTNILRNQYNVDFIVLLSHGGVSKDKKGNWSGEDIDIAKNVTGINLILGGHSHTPIHKPIIVNDTMILQSGSDTSYLGEVVIKFNGKKPELGKYTLHFVKDHILGDEEVQKLVEEAKSRVNKTFLEPEGLSFDQPIIKLNSTLSRNVGHNELSNMITQAIRQGTKSQIGFIPNGNIRDHIYAGQRGLQTVADIYRIAPLGIGKLTHELGYPLVKFYLTGSEIKNVIEILLVAYKDKGESYYPRFSGLQYYVNDTRVTFDQVMDLKVLDQNHYKTLDLSDPTQLYSIGTTSYVADFISLIEDVSHGLFKIYPKDKDGKVIENIQDSILLHPDSNQSKKELKLWKVVLDFFQNLQLTKLRSAEGSHKEQALKEPTYIKIHSWKLEDITKNATWIQWLYLLSLVFVFLLFLNVFIRVGRPIVKKISQILTTVIHNHVG